MYFLLLCILSSTGIFFTFKIIDRYNIPSYPVIVINYLIAAIPAAFLASGTFTFSYILHSDWLLLAILIGVLFILMFFVIAATTSKAGISVTTVASKMSVVIPITFSILIDVNDRLTLIKGAGIIFALTGVLLTVWNPDKGKSNIKSILLPVLLFFGMGIIDSLVKFSQHKYVPEESSAAFTSALFGISFLTGLKIGRAHV